MKKRLIKKICSIFLVFVFIMPLFCFSGCIELLFEDGDDSGGSGNNNNSQEDKPAVILTYKPFAGKSFSTDNLTSKTYGEDVYDDFLDLSLKVLSSLVDAYGQGSIGDGIFVEREINPSLNGVNIGEFLGNSSMSEQDQKTYAQEINKMLYASYSSKFSIDGVGDFDYKSLTLSKDGSGLTIYDIYSFVFRLNPTNEILAMAIEALGVELPDLDFVYFGDGEYIIKTDNAFVFITSSAASSFAPASNASNFVTRIMNTNFNVIEKGFKGFNGTFGDGNTVDLNFSRWNYNLFEGDSSQFETYSTINTPLLGSKGYLDAFLEKYLLDFAVEIAKVKLAGENSLPNYDIEISEEDIPSGFLISPGSFNLKNLYDSAQSTIGSSGGSQNDLKKKKFLEVASIFCDHKGLSQADAEYLYNSIKSRVIGEECYEEEEDNYYKNNYDKYVKFGTFTDSSSLEEENSALKDVKENNTEKAILEFYIKINSSVIEDYKIDGYLKSAILVLTNDSELDVETFYLEVKDTRPTSLDYLLMVRYFDGENFDKGYYGDVNKDLEDSSAVTFDVPDVVDSYTIKKFSDTITVEEFVYDKLEFEKDTNEYYHGWYYKGKNNSTFVEVVFASPNAFILQQVNIESLMFGV